MANHSKSVLSALQSKKEREAAELLMKKYRITYLEASNLVALVSLGKLGILEQALDRLESQRKG